MEISTTAIKPPAPAVAPPPPPKSTMNVVFVRKENTQIKTIRQHVSHAPRESGPTKRELHQTASAYPAILEDIPPKLL